MIDLVPDEKIPKTVTTYDIRLNKNEMAKDVICDICKKSCIRTEGMNFIEAEYATLFGHWGYFSNRDCTENSCDMCESCFVKVADFIVHELKGEIKDYDYSPRGHKPKP